MSKPNLQSSIGTLATSRASDPDFAISGKGAKPKRAARHETEAVAELYNAEPKADPGSQIVYTSYAVTVDQRELLNDHATERRKKKLANRFDASAVLRDVLGYWAAHQKEVKAWLETRAAPHTHSRVRRRGT